MVTKNLIRLLVCIFLSVVISSVLHQLHIEDTPQELPKTLFDIQGVLFPVALAIVTSLDLMRVRNKDYRTSFRRSIKRVRLSLIIQFTFSTISIISILFIGDSQQVFSYKIIALYPRLTGSIVIIYSIAHTIYNFTQMQKAKEDIEDRLQDEGV